MSARIVGEHVEIPAEEARSGQTGVHVRYVLIFSTVLVTLAFGVAALYFAANS